MSDDTGNDTGSKQPPLSNEELELGMGREITRRDFLNTVALGTGAALLGTAAPAARGQPTPVGAAPAAAAGRTIDPWTGPAGVGDYARANGNTWDVVTAGHGIRDNLYERSIAVAPATGEIYDLVVVGGGFSGVASAYFYLKDGGAGRTVLILDNNGLMGGEAKRNEFIVRGQRLIGPQGSNDTDAPRPSEGRRGEMWRDLGLPTDFEYGSMRSDRQAMLFGRDNFIHQVWADDFENHGFFYDEPTPHFVRNPWGHNLEGTPYSPEVRRDLLRWHNEPVEKWKGDHDSLKKYLDSMTYEQYLTNVRKLRPEVARYADPLLSASIGLGSDVLSAYAAFYDEFPGFTGLSPSGILFIREHKMANVPENFHSFPGGNDGIMRCIVKGLIPDAIEGSAQFAEIHNGRIRFDALDRPSAPVRMRTGATVVRLVHDADGHEPATVTYAREGNLHTVRGRAVIWAAANWTAKHAIQQLPDEYRTAMSEFPRAPMLVANVALDNWRFLYKLGYTACSWRGGFGFTCNLRPNMHVGDYHPVLDPDQPNILTFYVPFNQYGSSLADQGKTARARLFGTSYREYETQILQQMTKMFSAGGFDAKRDVSGIVLNRWGHAYITPGPGFYAGRDGKPAPSDVLRRPHGALMFAHSELAGNQNWVEASTEGRRAAHQALDMVKQA